MGALLCWLGFHDFKCVKWGEPFSPEWGKRLSGVERFMTLRRVYYHRCNRCGVEKQEEGCLVEYI